jgi:hypothetical protein
LQEVHWQWRVLQQITRPEPNGAPGIERLAKLAIGGAGSKMLLIDPAALLGFVDGQVMNLLENADEVIVYADRRKLLLEELEGFRAPGADDLHEFRTDLLLLVLDCLGPFVTLLLCFAGILALGNNIFAEVMNKSLVA